MLILYHLPKDADEQNPTASAKTAWEGQKEHNKEPKVFTQLCDLNLIKLAGKEIAQASFSDD